MKTARARIAAMFICCPNCSTELQDVDGSKMIKAGSGYLAGEVMTCVECGEEYRIPVVIELL